MSAGINATEPLPEPNQVGLEKTSTTNKGTIPLIALSSGRPKQKIEQSFFCFGLKNDFINNNQMLMEKTLEKKRFFPPLSLVFYFLVVISTLAFITRSDGLSEVITSAEQISPWMLILATGMQALTYVSNAFVYSQIAKIYQKQPLLTIGEFLNCSIIALFLNQALPSGGASGNSFMIFYLNKKNSDVKDSISIIALELFTYYAAHVALLLLLFLYFIAAFPQKISGLFFTVGLIGLILFIIFGSLPIILGNQKILLPLLEKIKKNKLIWKIFNKLREIFQFETDYEWEGPWEIVKRKRRELLKPFLGQIALFAFDITTIYFLFMGLGLPLSLPVVALGFMSTKIISMFSFMPGALLFFEGGMVLFYTLLGVPAAGAFVVTILFRALSFWLPMPLGLYLYRRLSNEDKKI